MQSMTRRSVSPSLKSPIVSSTRSIASGGCMPRTSSVMWRGISARLIQRMAGSSCCHCSLATPGRSLTRIKKDSWRDAANARCDDPNSAQCGCDVERRPEDEYGAGLMRGCQRHRDNEEQGRDAERNLQRNESKKQMTANARARGQPGGRLESPPQDGHEECQEPSDEAMIELDRRHVPEKMPPPRLEHEDLGGNDSAVHQRKRVVGEASPYSGDEAARQRHHEDDRDDSECERSRHALRRRSKGGPSRVRERQPDPEHRREDRERDAEMRGEPELRDTRVVDEAAFHHVPAHRTLQATQHKDAGALPPV